MSVFTFFGLKPTDARGWIGAGCFILVLVVFAMVAKWPQLLDNDAFLVLATAIVITGWVNGPVGWAYQATKSGGDAAESAARIAEQAAAAALPSPPVTPPAAEE
jgi:hypothetical protein